MAHLKILLELYLVLNIFIFSFLTDYLTNLSPELNPNKVIDNKQQNNYLDTRLLTNAEAFSLGLGYIFSKIE